MFAVIKDISYLNIAILAVLGFLILFLNGLMLKIFLYPFNISMSLSECFGVSAISAMGNYLAPFGGGTVGKAVYLKRRYDFPYSAFLALMSVTSILDILMAILLGSGVVIFTGNMLYPWKGAFLLLFLTLVIALVAVFSLNRLIPDIKFFKIARDALEGWRMLCGRRYMMTKISMLLLTNYLLSSAELFTGYGAFSVGISPADAILLSTISSLSSIIRFTPANIGFQEAVIASSSHLLGVGLREGLLAAGLLRVVSIGVIFLSGCFYMMVYGNLKGQVGNESVFTRS